MTFRQLWRKVFPVPTPVIDARIFDVKCECGHVLDRHNDKDPYGLDEWFQGNCRMCPCKGFKEMEVE